MSQKLLLRAIKMTQPGKHALNPNVQFSQIVSSVATPMNVFSNVFVNSKQSTKTVLVRLKDSNIRTPFFDLINLVKFRQNVHLVVRVIIMIAKSI